MRSRWVAVCAAVIASACGCHTTQTAFPVVEGVPRELTKQVLPEYRIEPPDILILEGVRLIPKPPYKIEPLDVLFVQLADPLPTDPLSGPVTVDPEGYIDLGTAYKGRVNVAGKTLDEASAAVEKHLREVAKIRMPSVRVGLSQSRGAQQVSGPHLVRPDGTVGLGTYGSVPVVGLTLAEAKGAIEARLGEFLLDPKVTVDIQGYNSKVYYLIYDGGGSGQQVYRLPSTGNETVLDAVSQVNGLSPVSSTDCIWVARPTSRGGPYARLPVDWPSVTMDAGTDTNYQILPGDRVYVDSQRLIKIDTKLAKLLAPVERIFGIGLLGRSLFGNRNNNNGGF